MKIPMKIKVEELQRGDHICTDRNLKSYYHHGIYIGGDRVIHFSLRFRIPSPQARRTSVVTTRTHHR
jgi:hypothetical protein